MPVELTVHPVLEGARRWRLDRPLDDLIRSWPSFCRHLPVTRRAVRYALQLHAGQRRESDRAAFVLHPLETASLLHNAGADDELIAAGVLHEALESAPVSPAEIEQRFGTRVAHLVASVTEDPEIPEFDERKAALRENVAAAGREAAVLEAADKVAKLRELRMRAAQDSRRFGPASDEAESQARLRHYRAMLDILESQIGEHPLVRQLRFELESFAALPPGASAPRGAPLNRSVTDT